MIDFFLKRVNKKIKDLNLNNKDICVLKGIPISLVDRSIKIDISQIILDKLNYFMKIGVCQEKCVSFFVSFFTSVNLFCYLQIYHHHF